METTTRLILPEVEEALRRSPEELTELTEELHPADLADLATALEPELSYKLLTLLPIDEAARLLEQLEEDPRADLFASLAERSVAKAANIGNEMVPDDRADLFARLPQDLRTSLIAAMDEEESKDIRQLLAYPEDSAGALLTTDFIALSADLTVSEAIERVRKVAEEMETIYQAYAVDPNGTLLGAVSLRDLVLSRADRKLHEIMNPHILSVPVEADQEEVARLISKYDLLAIPVVDRSHRIVGIITVDDVIDVVEEEATEDVQKLGAVEPLEAPYVSTPVWDLIKARAPWLMILFVAVLFTRNVIEHYHQIGLASVAMLTWFVPLVVSAGGNSGAQSATLVIRALATGRLEMPQAAKVLARELLIGLLLGGLLAAVGIISVLAFPTTRIAGMAITMGIAVIAVVSVGALLGSGVPLLLHKLRIDPAVSSTPFIASLVDVAGLVIYFEIGRLFLD